MTEDDAMMEYLRSCSIPEDNVIDELQKQSPEFKFFYSSEGNRIRSPILWLHNEKLRKGDQLQPSFLAETKTFPNGFVGIIIRNNPAKIGDSSTIAHELAHVIFGDEGFPRIGHYRGCEDIEVITLAGMFSNMIHDPLVIEKLLKYGYDLRQEYAKECMDGIKRFKKRPEYTGIARIKASFLFAQSLIEYDLLFDENNNPCYECISKMDEHFPNIMKDARKIHELVKTNGIESPEKVDTLIQNVIKMHPGLSDLLEIYH